MKGGLRTRNGREGCDNVPSGQDGMDQDLVMDVHIC